MQADELREAQAESLAREVSAIPLHLKSLAADREEWRRRHLFEIAAVEENDAALTRYQRLLALLDVYDEAIEELYVLPSRTYGRCGGLLGA